MICLSFLMAAIGIAQWTADQDYNLVGAQVTGTSANAVVSLDPSLTTATISSPATGIRDNVYFWCQGAQLKQGFSVSIPVPKGTTLFVAISAQGTVLLYLEPIVLS